MMSDNIVRGEELINPFNGSLSELIMSLLKLHSDKVLQVDATNGKEFTGRGILEISINLARWLHLKGVRPGDTVAVLSENRPEFCLVMYAVILSGATIVPLNPDYTTGELQNFIEMTKPKLIFLSRTTFQSTVLHEPTFITFHKKLVMFEVDNIPIIMINFVKTALEGCLMNSEASEKFTLPAVNPKETVAAILFSSGTTGLPKGVMITHYNIVSVLSVMKQQILNNARPTSQFKSIGVSPSFHSFGFMQIISSLVLGSKLIVMRKFNLNTFLSAIENYKVDMMSVPPPVVVMLCQSSLTKKYDLSSVKTIRCGAASLGSNFETKIHETLKDLQAIVQVYGLTELTLCVLLMPAGTQRFGSAGTVVPGMQAKIIGENGEALGPKQKGELCFKGPLVMKGYIGNAKATAETIDSDGWLHTGDIGYYDDEGYFYIVDRIKELIKYKGFQVAPTELEALLTTHPSVQDAAVIGIPDDMCGELPMGIVVLKPGSNTSSNDIIKYVNERVSKHKFLKGGLKIVQSIPRTSTGKILRRQLKKNYARLHSKI